MIFHPQNIIKTNGNFTFSGNIEAIAHSCLNKDVIKDFWHGFTYQCSELNIRESNEFIFSIGSTKPLSLDNCNYSINVDGEGVCVYADNEKDLIDGFMTLLDRFKAEDDAQTLKINLECCQIKDKPLIKNRMVHFCIFPETEIWELERFIRLCAALKYTHVVLEFWGMLKYDCMPELSWSHAYTKDQIRPIVQEANDLGIEIIPMFNHWGHATASRVMHGKHVVLDQNPALQTYFSEDGWCWDIKKPKVRELMRKIRNELTELCKNGKYFHIGCDEAYNFEFTKENMDYICDYINEISTEMGYENRKIIAWGDMFLYRLPHYNPKNIYTCFSKSIEASEYMISRLNKNVVIADWQYDCVEAPIETAAVFHNAGFETLLCPWARGHKQIAAVQSTVKSQDLSGLLHTTWHTLSTGMPCVTIAAVGCFEAIENRTYEELRTCTAALLRKVMPCGGDYQKAGWSKTQVDDYLW